MASLVRFRYGLSGCSPPCADLTGLSPANGGFYIQASDESVTLPAAGYHYNSNWTPLLAGLSPAGTAASFAAPDLAVQSRNDAIEKVNWGVVGGCENPRIHGASV